MGSWYGPGGKLSEREGRIPDRRDDGDVVRPGEDRILKPPCPNGVLLTDPEAPFNGTKRTDRLGRTWGCPSTVEGGTDATTEGVWKMPDELQSLWGGLLTRANELLGAPLGYSQDAQDYMFGRGFEGLRGQESANRNTLLEGLSRSGMLDTGAGMGVLNQNAWNTQGSIADLMRDIYVKNEEQKKADMLANTQLAQSLFGTGLGASQLEEMLNAARRGEASQFFQMMLAWLQTLKG